jgi:hypothetical protein
MVDLFMLSAVLNSKPAAAWQKNSYKNAIAKVLRQAHCTEASQKTTA